MNQKIHYVEDGHNNMLLWSYNPIYDYKMRFRSFSTNQIIIFLENLYGFVAFIYIDF